MKQRYQHLQMTSKKSIIGETLTELTKLGDLTFGGYFGESNEMRLSSAGELWIAAIELRIQLLETDVEEGSRRKSELISPPEPSAKIATDS
ncbi:unnamed protein product [Didymodactylos carnosus]|uniref:Uncharacterized protein n=1 Tax=Didymodactylos carnosus TaxID=1234261 RepID=A0A8S2LAA0_9BILA|nr:unnamed protein product [Didymodactylos carnosus]CAF3892880.1 unnamed protein product [Didymodactylos carnosus]